MCNCCNGVGHEFESREMRCKIIIRDNIMSVCLPWNSVDLEVKVCPLCGRILDNQNITVEEDKSTGGFLPYQSPDDRYEVRGVMPKAPKYPKRNEEEGVSYEK